MMLFAASVQSSSIPQGRNTNDNLPLFVHAVSFFFAPTVDTMDNT